MAVSFDTVIQFILALRDMLRRSGALWAGRRLAAVSLRACGEAGVQQSAGAAFRHLVCDAKRLLDRLQYLISEIRIRLRDRSRHGHSADFGSDGCKRKPPSFRTRN
ncbi:hypothetical protein [Bradyrhizobium pachyrhizi]|uniref:hypothetical protein n=1 Tax=Bradyrhizobium pachyrhizi TaxID=280333 RepID=UPI0012E3B1C9|nr:hypothetical protein [Bradyrhizobium pachyrhizi]